MKHIIVLEDKLCRFINTNIQKIVISILESKRNN